VVLPLPALNASPKSRRSFRSGVRRHFKLSPPLLLEYDLLTNTHHNKGNHPGGAGSSRRNQHAAIGECRMTSFDDPGKMFLRNKLVGRWAADKLGIVGRDADEYSEALAEAAFDPERENLFSKIRKDFDAAGVVQTDEQILQVMTEFLIKAGKAMSGGPGDSLRGAGVMLARKLMSR
jgi:hypothetical protein